jgi:hypothetical protein
VNKFIAGKPEAIAECFSGIMRKGDVGVLVHDDLFATRPN